MNIKFYFGPEKIAFKLMGNGVVKCDLTTPFHGIISRGLLNKFIENNLSYNLWYQYLHHLFNDSLVDSSDIFREIKIQAEKCSVLSFGQSAYAVKIYVSNYFKDKIIDNAEVELWNIKEGHTSSVWKILICEKNYQETFILNVSRDYQAGIELKESSEKLVAIGNQFPEINLAKVYEIYSLKDPNMPSEVIITRNEWIDNASEIHLRKNKKTDAEELLMVERFLTDQNNPAKITSVRGRIFSVNEDKKIRNEMNNFLIKATQCLCEKPKLNINDGDAVWNGQKVVIVALS